jgi:hypothetical protein
MEKIGKMKCRNIRLIVDLKYGRLEVWNGGIVEWWNSGIVE